MIRKIFKVFFYNLFILTILIIILELLLGNWFGEKFKYLRQKHLTDSYGTIFCQKCLNNVDCKTTSLEESFHKKI